MNWGWINCLTLFTCSNSWPYICFGNRWANPQYVECLDVHYSHALSWFDYLSFHYSSWHKSEVQAQLQISSSQATFVVPGSWDLPSSGSTGSEQCPWTIRTLLPATLSFTIVSGATFCWWPSCIHWSFRWAYPPAIDTCWPSLFLSAWLCISIVMPDWCPSVPHWVQSS